MTKTFYNVEIIFGGGSVVFTGLGTIQTESLIEAVIEAGGTCYVAGSPEKIRKEPADDEQQR